MKKWLSITLIVALLASAGVYTVTLPTHTNTANYKSQAVTITSEELLKLINEERSRVNVPPLAIDPLLELSAQRKANEMVVNNNTEHLGKDGIRGAQYANQTGIMCKTVSENIISNNDRTQVKTAKEAVDGWMSSDSHRAALLDPKYTSTGFGINRWAVTEHFCEK